jgi:hypothetical protein
MFRVAKLNLQSGCGVRLEIAREDLFTTAIIYAVGYDRRHEELCSIPGPISCHTIGSRHSYDSNILTIFNSLILIPIATQATSH